MFEREDDPAFDRLIRGALGAQDRAYAPYSKFSVGAALECADGSVVVGCNVENASYGGTICAERSALVAAVSLGQRRFRACVVVTRGPTPSYPCGFCRQMLYEFARELPILLVAREGGARKLVTLSAILPGAFGPDDLGSDGSGEHKKSNSPRREAEELVCVASLAFESVSLRCRRASRRP